jgi:hypothetical protein
LANDDLVSFLFSHSFMCPQDATVVDLYRTQDSRIQMIINHGKRAYSPTIDSHKM